MFKVMIADDEAIIRNGLASFLEENKDFQVIAMAEDGEDALGKAKECEPDLILADINMPFMSGLEFIEEVRKILPDVVVVIITGYDNFEYVQKALQLGVKDYILKPVMEDKFFELMNKMKECMEKESKSRKYITWARNQMERNKQMLIENLFTRKIAGHLDDIEFEERLQYLGISIAEEYAITMISLKDNYNHQTASEDTGWDDNLLYFACQNIVQEVLQGEKYESVCFRSPSGTLAIITEDMPQPKWEELKDRIICPVEAYLDVRMTISHVSGSGIQSFSETFDKAEEELYAQLKYSDIVLRMLEYIEREYADSDLSLQRIADRLHISPQYLSRLFRRETGDTFVTCLSRLRLQKAMKMLRNTDMKIYEITEKTGYTTQHYFSSAFKKYLGMSPMEYRKKMI